MKKKVLVLAVLAIAIAIAATGTLAYFTATGTARNVITSGGISIAIEEKTQNGDALVDFPKGGLQGIMPGTTASKIVRIKNTGPNEAWIRVQITSYITGSDKEELPDMIDGQIPVMTYEVLPGWTLKDGWYYYNDPVAPGAKTDELLQEVAFAPQMGNEYQNCRANLVITAEAVQTANNGETVLEALGWPSEKTD